MKSLLLPLALATLGMTAGCVSWKDQAQADALALCENKGDAEARRLCRETVIAAAEAENDAALAKSEQERLRREECTRLQRVYGDPGDKRQKAPC